jgi:hypothetical protein
MSANRLAVTWQVIFAVLPAFALCVALRVAVARVRERDLAAPGGPDPLARFGMD